MLRNTFRDLRTAIIALVLFSALLGIAYPYAITGRRAGGVQPAGERQRDQRRRAGRRARRSSARTSASPRVLPPAAFRRRRGRLRRQRVVAARTWARRARRSRRASPATSTKVRQENGLAADATVPVDAVTASGSGLDPHISPAYADLQVSARRAGARPVRGQVRELVGDNTDGSTLGVARRAARQRAQAQHRARPGVREGGLAG